VVHQGVQVEEADREGVQVGKAGHEGVQVAVVAHQEEEQKGAEAVGQPGGLDLEQVEQSRLGSREVVL
jgi:hypothetical protein